MRKIKAKAIAHLTHMHLTIANAIAGIIFTLWLDHRVPDLREQRALCRQDAEPEHLTNFLLDHEFELVFWLSTLSTLQVVDEEQQKGKKIEVLAYT